jgi:hypothetical protein
VTARVGIRIMQNIIVEKPYEFVPPYASRFWRHLVQLYLPRAL